LLAASVANADDPKPPGSEKAPKVKLGLCTVVGKGGVGESGPSSLVHHQVTGKREIVMVVRNTNSSLCPNTGAVAVLIVNGQAAATGMIDDKKSSIQASAKPGDHVVALVHAIPLFNGIACIRLGELEFTLEQCDLE
jgi:hypothetical protein